MTCKNFVILIKVLITLILTYSAFMIVLISAFDLLSVSIYMSLMTFLIERIFPNISAVIALVFLIRYIWIADKKPILSRKDSIDRNNYP